MTENDWKFVSKYVIIILINSKIFKFTNSYFHILLNFLLRTFTGSNTHNQELPKINIPNNYHWKWMKIGQYVLHGHINKWWKFHFHQLIISRYFKFLFTVTWLSPAFHFRENPLEKCDKSNDRPGGRVTEAKNFPVPRTFFERKKKGRTGQPPEERQPEKKTNRTLCRACQGREKV